MTVRIQHPQPSNVLNRKNCIFITLVCHAFLALLLTLSLIISSSYSVRTWLFAVMVIALTAATDYASWWVFVLKPRQSAFGQTDTQLLVRLFLSSILLSVFFEIGTLAGAQCVSPFVLSDWQPLRLGLYALGSFTSLVFLTCIYESVPTKPLIMRPKLLRLKLAPVLHLMAKAMVVLSIALLTTSIGWLVLHFAPIPLFFLSLGVTTLAYSCVKSLGSASIKPQHIFAAIALSVGFSIISAFPASNLMSWDDEVHYANALNLSYVMNPEVSSSDRMLQTLNLIEPGFSDDATLGRNEIAYTRGRTWTQQEFSYDQARTWKMGDIASYTSELDSNDIDRPAEGAGGFAPIVTNYSALSYIPAALGLWLGRLLGLSFTFTFALGKLFNLLCYTAIVFTAIHIIPVKKWLLLALSLLPTNLFLASNYSYDWFLTAFTMLAIALIVRIICSEEKARTRDLWLILICLFLAIAPKAVYFPIVGLIFLVPSKAFQSRTQKRVFIAAAVAIVVYACLTFLLPVLFSGGDSYSDSRAGTGASPALQLAFILSEPLAYLKILASYLYHEFFALGNIETAFADYYYMGQLTEVFSTFQGMLLVCGCFIALTDSSERSAKLISSPSILWCAFMALCTAALISSALYVSFTEVGLNTVIGVQPRYFLPLLPLLGIFVFNFPLENHIPDRAYGISVSFMSGGLPLLTTWLFVVSRVVV